MFKIRDWERYKFLIDYEQIRVNIRALIIFMMCIIVLIMSLDVSIFFQHKDILERHLPDSLKLNIAKRIENNLYSKVVYIQQ
jgi:hypothetical protein